LIVEREELQSVLERLRTAPELAIDLETTSLSPHDGGRLFGFAICDGVDTYYFDFEHGTLEWSDLALFHPLFADMSKLWINHNIKFDQGFLRREGMPLQGRLWCTHVMARVEWNDHMRYSLDACGERIGIAKSGEVKEYLDGHGLFEMVQMPDKKKRFKNYYFAKVPLSIIAPYCEQDVRVAWKLYQHQKPNSRRPVCWRRWSGTASVWTGSIAFRLLGTGEKRF
jgi:DNA polymerase I-like protein with 3'-5' exonuclease and polymerase domains